MKNKIIILLISVFGLTSAAISQVYISKTAKPFNDIVNTTHLTLTKRVSYDNAYQTINNFGINGVNRAALAGEYFLYENMVIKLVVITERNSIFFKPLHEVQSWNRTLVSGGEDRPIGEYYVDFHRDFTSHKTYVNYFKENSDKINFVTQDKLGRYAIAGVIYHSKTDKTKATNFIDTLLTSMSFK